MDKHEHTSMRRSQSHAAHRASQNPLSNSTSPEPLPTVLPSLEPVGCIPPYAIDGQFVERGHNAM
eukprot:2730082-Karenia_brevis.AAC.1